MYSVAYPASVVRCGLTLGVVTLCDHFTPLGPTDQAEPGYRVGRSGVENESEQSDLELRP